MIKTIGNDKGLTEFLADTTSDIEKLSEYSANAGSTCLVIQTSSVWILGNDGEWHEL